MFRFCLLTLVLFLSISSFSQRQFPSLPVNIDSLFDICNQPKTPAKEKLRLLSVVDSAIDNVTAGYPLFRGMVYMYQSYHAPEGEQRKQYAVRGFDLISNNKQLLADSFSYQCYQLLDYYSWSKRLGEWQPIDSILRSVVTVQPQDEEWCIFTYANTKMSQGSYRIADNLASYDLLYSKKVKPSSIDHRIVRIYDEWISVNSRYQEWLQVPYYQRNVNFTLKEFRNVFSHLRETKDSAVQLNVYGSKDFQKYRRILYYRIYKDAVLAYAGWSINDHREGQAILPLKNFLLVDVMNEVREATASKEQSLISCKEITDLYSKLAELYINTGNGKEADEMARNGIAFFNKYKHCSDIDESMGIAFLYYLRAKANRIEGKYESSLKKTDILKQWYPLPKTLAADSINYWNWYIEVRLQEVYTLMAQQKKDEAGDSLSLLLETINPLDSLQLLEQSYQWPQLQFASMQFLARRGKWDAVKDYTLEALKVLEQKNHWENVPYYYDLQLLYFISKYRTEKTILKHIAYNMLFYTGRQLQYTFFMLTPEDRIRLYEQKLSVYFDVYHELLMSKMVDDDSALRHAIINQSLYLKNALIDANLLPNEFLAVNKNWLELVEGIRKNRSRGNVLNTRWKMIKKEDTESLYSEDIQTLWLQLLDNANMDSLVQFTGWTKIANALKPQQVYVETIRYTNWLTDSTSSYGAYFIADNKLELLRLFNEGQMVKLLKDPSSSPQSGSLNVNNGRGFTLTKKDTTVKKFQPGSEDKLGTLVLDPLSSYFNNKKELLLVPDGLLNRISLAALQYKGQYLFSKVKLKQLSGSYVLYQPDAGFPINGKALLAGGLNYSETTDEVNVNRLLDKNYSWPYLPATKTEVLGLAPIFKTAGEKVTLVTGEEFADSLIDTLHAYHFIHLATHGFYVDSSTAKTFYNINVLNTETIQNDAMTRCGIAISSANFPEKKEAEADGYLLGFELANTDLRNCYLIGLSACETGLGDLRNNLGVDGLSRALKLGGAKYLLISLWKVPDAPTAVFMQQFYKEMFRLKDPVAALQSTQAFMSKKYDVADWAAFVLVE